MLDWLSPQTVEEVTSKVNGQIRVSQFRGKYSLWVAGFEQSGPIYVEKIWKEALGKVSLSPKKILILGLGAGTAIPLLTRKWPKAKITGVEIDSLMVTLGKNYFHLSDYPNLTIKIADARKLNLPLPRFDLVLVDCYLGNKEVRLGANLRRFLRPGGVALVNRLVGIQSRIELQAYNKARDKR